MLLTYRRAAEIAPLGLNSPAGRNEATQNREVVVKIKGARAAGWSIISHHDLSCAGTV